MKKKVIYINLDSLIMIIILSIILFVSIIKIKQWNKNNKDNELIKNEIQQTAIIPDNEDLIDSDVNYSVDFKTLKETNSNIVGWIEVPNTNINYPVVKAKDNSYYLTHNFNDEYNSSGWIFADYNNKVDGNDKNLVIYGHNVRDNSMFGSLKNILNEEWYNNEQNYKIIFITENATDVYEVFSIYQIEVEDYYIQTMFKNDNEYEIFLNTLKKRSIKDFKQEVSAEDNILTLSTCANSNRYRIVLHAKKCQERDFDYIHKDN